MFKASKLFALLSVFVLVYGVSYAQNTPKTIQPMESGFQVFTNDGESYLGVQTQAVTKENFSKFGLREVRGVAIEKVIENSPAKKGGLQDDDVIVQFNGEEVSSYQKLSRLINETAPDHQAKITISRGGNERDVTITIGKHPTPKLEMGNFTATAPEQMGGETFGSGIITVTAPEQMGEGNFGQVMTLTGSNAGEVGKVSVLTADSEGGDFVLGSTSQIGVSGSGLTKQLADYFGVVDGKGILINNVSENSPAAKAGLKAGDVIVEVEGKAVTNMMELIRGVSGKKEGEVTLTILRNRNRQNVKVTPEKMKEVEGLPFKVSSQPQGAITVRSTNGVAAPAGVKMINRIL